MPSSTKALLLAAALSAVLLCVSPIEPTNLSLGLRYHYPVPKANPTLLEVTTYDVRRGG